MTVFRTVIKPPFPAPDMELGEGIVCIGSCFAQRIGQYFEDHFLPCLINPNGTLYHPIPIADLLNRLADPTSVYEPSACFELNNRWYSNYHQGQHSAGTESELLSILNDTLSHTRSALNDADVIIITLGTAWGYILNASGQCVANCHKRPATCFTRHLFEPEILYSALKSACECLKAHYSHLSIILTVSPVRHLRDNPFHNSVSKAHLLSVAYKLQEDHLVTYFPSYELMLDDLRDYRFYDPDMAHPSITAVSYIADVYTEWAYGEKGLAYVKQAEALRRRYAHKPIDTQSDAAQRFQKTTKKVATELKRTYPFACVEVDP